MKLILGYIASFLMMTALVTFMCFGIFAFAIGLVVFITWSLPYAPISWWLALRTSIAIGAVIGVFFICSKEGQESSKEIADDL